MNVRQLIAELEKMPPQMPAHVVTSTVSYMGELGDYEVDLDELDATEADDVRVIGGYVLVKGR